MSIYDEFFRLKVARDELKQWLGEQGVYMPAESRLDDLVELVKTLSNSNADTVDGYHIKTASSGTGTTGYITFIG